MKKRGLAQSNTGNRAVFIFSFGSIVFQLVGVFSIAAQPVAEQHRTGWKIPANETIHAMLAERLAENGVGAVLGVLEPAGKRIIVYGKSGARDGRTLDGDTVFQIGSVTKVFTGLLLADMAVRGEVGLDDPAAKYLPPGVKMPRHGRPITLIDLSKHWSGLPSMPTNFSLDAQPNPYQAYTEKQLYAFLNSYEPTREPGKQEYSNLGVALLGRLLARRGRMEYEPFLRQRVLAPLDLDSTSISLTPDQRTRLAPGHDRFGQPVETWELKAMPASGSLRSTVNDLLRFLEFNLGIRDTSLNSAMQLQRIPGKALGWGRSTLAGEAVYGHEGGKEGYRSAVLFNPQTRTGIVVLLNSRNNISPMVIARYLLGGQQLPPLSPTASRPQPVLVSRKTLDTYTGQYRLESGIVLRVVRRDDYLWVNSPGDGVSTLFPSASNSFFSNTEDLTINFVHDAQSHVTGLELRTDDGDQRGTRVSAASDRVH